MKILVNTISTKKHSGGAYQIAYNFLVKTIEHQEVEWVYVVSKDLDAILPEPIRTNDNYFVFPTQPDFKHSYKQVKKQLAELEDRMKPDVVYSITAPSYFTFKSKEVMRFTMPWVTHPNKYSWSVLSWREKVKMHLYCWNQRRLIRKAKYFITQTETTREGILRITGTAAENVRVVRNVLPPVFSQVDDTPLPSDDVFINIACVGNATRHKNFDIIPCILYRLKELGIKNVRFHVTLPDDTPVWKEIQIKANKLGIMEGIVNHGRISQVEMAEMYRHCQLCFLPTLLEVFSASTVEAMYFHLPIIASDFEFNREVMDDACLYYKPKNAQSAAECIRELIIDKKLGEEMREKMKRRLSLFCDYDKHFNDIMSFLKWVSER